MHVDVNGEARDVETGTTVADLLRRLEVRADRVAVELNLEILDPQEFDRRPLSEGDRVEILSFIGGGAVRSQQTDVAPPASAVAPERARRRVTAWAAGRDRRSARG